MSKTDFKIILVTIMISTDPVNVSVNVPVNVSVNVSVNISMYQFNVSEKQ